MGNVCSAGRFPGKTGVPGEEREVLNHPLPADNLSRSPAGLHDNDTLPASAKTNEHPGHVLSPPCSKECCSECSIGRMSHASQTGILIAPLHYRGLERVQLQAVLQYGHRRRVVVPLSSQALDDLNWWVLDSSRASGCPIQLPPIDTTIWTDASKRGWGATYQGISTGGHWGAEETKEHINVLELRAATLALQAFLPPQLPGPKHVHLRIDNTTVLAYINKRGDTHSPVLTAQALELWEVALDAGVSLTAQHIPGIQNTAADIASRQIESRTEWTLDKKIFQSICQKFYKPEVDLFASRLNHQVP